MKLFKNEHLGFPLEIQEVPGDDKNLHFPQTSQVIREIWFCKRPSIPYYSHFPIFF